MLKHEHTNHNQPLFRHKPVKNNIPIKEIEIKIEELNKKAEQ